MDRYEQIAGAFHRRIEAITFTVDAIAAPLEHGAQLLASAALEDRKILICACGRDGALAPYLASMLRTADRGPALPAQAQPWDTLPDEGSDYWQDLRTLARDGDVLLCLDTQPGAPLASRCAPFAAQRNLQLICVSEQETAIDGIVLPLLGDDSALRSELLLMIAHCLRDQVWKLLLGE